MNVQQQATNCSGVRKPPIVVASLQNLSIDGSGLSVGLAKSVALHHCPSAGTIKDKLVDLRRALRVIMVDLFNLFDPQYESECQIKVKSSFSN